MVKNRFYTSVIITIYYCTHLTNYTETPDTLSSVSLPLHFKVNRAGANSQNGILCGLSAVSGSFVSTLA